MKILHIATTNGGGAGKAAYRLHRGLLELGQESAMLVLKKSGEDPTVEEFSYQSSVCTSIISRFKNNIIDKEFKKYRPTRPAGLEMFSDDRSAILGRWLAKKAVAYDVINLHWVAGLIDYESFFSAISKIRKPIAWTLHDMNPFTGGCHYDNGCEKYIQQCGKCPQLGSDDLKDLSFRILQRKHKAILRIPREKLIFVTPSHWLAKKLEKKHLFNQFNISVIPNGLNTSSFKPQNQQSARIKLGIPKDSKVILFVSDSIRNVRKGYRYLMEALEELSHMSNLFLITMGKGRIDDNHTEISQKHFEDIRDENYQSMIYSAADVFVLPSLEDNLPNTILESMACGTPVVAFKIGGVPDIVKPHKTGLLAAAENTGDLADKIQWLLEHPEERKTMNYECRQTSNEYYSLATQAGKYLEVYSNLVTETNSHNLGKIKNTA